MLLVNTGATYSYRYDTKFKLILMCNIDYDDDSYKIEIWFYCDFLKQL